MRTAIGALILVVVGSSVVTAVSSAPGDALIGVFMGSSILLGAAVAGLRVSWRAVGPHI